MDFEVLGRGGLFGRDPAPLRDFYSILAGCLAAGQEEPGRVGREERRGRACKEFPHARDRHKDDEIQ